jgi:hypothetical protein
VSSSSHHHHRLRPAVGRGESGASLMLALVFVIVVFTIITGVLTYAFGAGRSVEVYERDQALHYAADAALEAAVQMVKIKTYLGQTDPLPPYVPAAPLGSSCALALPIPSPPTSTPPSAASLSHVHDPGLVFASTARLNVTCNPTPTVTSGGYEPQAAGAGQLTRDVTFEVVCLLPPTVRWDRPLACGTPNTNPLVLARARVRYDIDPGHGTPAQRARVPKVISWEILR